MVSEGAGRKVGDGAGIGPGGISIARPPVTKVVIVADAPSSALLPVYHASQTFDEESARRMIFAAGDPGRLLVRIEHFLNEMWDAQREEKMAQLYKLFHYGHLVYLSRSPTDERPTLGGTGLDEARKEVDELLDQGVLAIVALGETAKNWVRTYYPPEGLMLVFLPQPSNHISSWYPSFLEKASRERGTDALAIRDSMAVQIDKLVRLCRDL